MYLHIQLRSGCSHDLPMMKKNLYLKLKLSTDNLPSPVSWRIPLMPFKTSGMAAEEMAFLGCEADKERLGAQINLPWDFEISVVPSAIAHQVHKANKIDYL